jgi:hypothetical protein
LAGSTGLEPAASGVTGRRSNQLNYDPESELTLSMQNAKCRRQNPQSIGTTFSIFHPAFVLMGGTGFEPVTAGV